ELPGEPLAFGAGPVLHGAQDEKSRVGPPERVVEPPLAGIEARREVIEEGIPPIAADADEFVIADGRKEAAIGEELSLDGEELVPIAHVAAAGRQVARADEEVRRNVEHPADDAGVCG